MARMFSLPYQMPPICLLPPAADAAGRSSGWRNIRSVDKAYVVCHINQGNAAPVSLTVQQATSIAGAGAKALLAAVPIWLNDATATSDAYTALAAALSYTTDATIADKIVIFELLPEACIDVQNAFHYINVTTGASNAANITEAELFLVTDYQQAVPITTYT